MNAVARLPRAVAASAGVFLDELYPIDAPTLPLDGDMIADLDYLAAILEDVRNTVLYRLSAIDGETGNGPSTAERPAAGKQQLAVAGHPSITAQLGAAAADQLDAWANHPTCPRQLYCRLLASSLRRAL